MPNSAWTETGASISLVPTTSTIDGGSSASNVNYLTNSDKIALMAQYAGELAMKTSLDSLATTWSVSSTAYDNAVAAISTALVTAGAPSAWATAWPDGTTSGPWAGIKTSLSNLWAAVATQRTALQSTISNAQAASAQGAAIAAAATDATSKMNAAITAVGLSPVVVSSLPTLPSATYPSGRLVWNTADGQLYRSTGSAWTVLSVAAPDITGTLTAAQIAGVAASQVTGQLSDSQLASISAAKVSGTITNGQLPAAVVQASTGINKNLVPDSDFKFKSTYWTGAFTFTPGGGYKGSNLVSVPASQSGNRLQLSSAMFPVTPGASYTLSMWIDATHVAAGSALLAWVSDGVYHGITMAGGSSGWVSNTFTIPVGITSVSLVFDQYNAVVASGSVPYLGAYSAPMLQMGTVATAYEPNAMDDITGSIPGTIITANTITANQLAANTITATQIAANTITGSNLVAGTVTAAQIAAGTITGNNIAAQTITGANLVADTITATQIAANAITSSELAAGAVVAGKIAAGTIQAGDIAANTITGAKIAANTITASNIAANTITASQIASNTITAGQIAAGAIGASEIAAGAITASKVVLTGSNMVLDPFGQDPAYWSVSTPTTTITGITDLPAGSTAIANTVPFAAIFSGLIPIDTTANYFLSVNMKRLSGAAGGQNYVSVQWCDAGGNSMASSGLAPAGWVNGNYSYYGNIGGDISTTWTQYSVRFGPNCSYAIPASARYIRVGVLVDWSGHGSYQVACSGWALNKQADGNLIVDGTITASKIAAGAITANMITTGTLNAANVAITNLNASNITTGTLSAAKVLFSDGSALTTASRVQTALANESATATTSGTGAPGTLISGLSFSLNAASTADVYNFFGSMSGGQTAGTVGTTVGVNLYVDGVYNQSASLSYATLNGTQSNSFVMSLTGLSAGAHTIQFYLRSSLSTATFQSYVGSSILCQRIF